MSGRVLVLLSFISFFISCGTGDSDVQKWEKTYGGINDDNAFSVQQTTDKGYIIAGATNSIDASSYDAYLIKIDTSGNKVWEKTFGGTNNDAAYSVEETSDKGFIIAGWTSSMGAGSDDVYLLKTDSLGNELWHKTFGGTDCDRAYSVQQTSDQGYIIAGSTLSMGAGSGDVYLIKTDSSGNELWHKTFGGTGSEGASAVRQTSDGGYIVAGAISTVNSGDMYLIKTDSSGNELWEKTFGGTGNELAHSVQQTSDGGYILVGITYSNFINNSYMVKTDSLGNKIWEKMFDDGTDDDYANDVKETRDGGYVIAGLKSVPPYWGLYDVYLRKTDSSGNKLWEKTCGGTYDDANANSVQLTSDGGYILAGSIDFLIGQQRDVYLIKTDSSVNSPCRTGGGDSVGPPQAEIQAALDAVTVQSPIGTDVLIYGNVDELPDPIPVYDSHTLPTLPQLVHGQLYEVLYITAEIDNNYYNWGSGNIFRLRIDIDSIERIVDNFDGFPLGPRVRYYSISGLEFLQGVHKITYWYEHIDAGNPTLLAMREYKFYAIQP